MIATARAAVTARAPSPCDAAVAEWGAGDRAAVDGVLSEFLAARESSAHCTELKELVGWLRAAVAGGKRLRSALCCQGWRTCGDGEPPSGVVRLAASLELFHAFAVIQDDVMDGSSTRRGRPTLHRLVATRHGSRREAERLGAHTAILVGDLAFGWSYELVSSAEIEAHTARAVWSALDAMRIETMIGQYLDLTGSDVLHNGDAGDVDAALRVARAKTAAYTVAWPLRIGAIAAGAGSDLLHACTTYGVAVGEAFQLRDDLLGVFGDPRTTGKSALEDLRAGKPTVLLALAWQRATAAQRARLRELVSDRLLDETGAGEIRAIFASTGARATVEDMIDERRRHALDAIARSSFAPAAATGLAALADAATIRDR